MNLYQTGQRLVMQLFLLTVLLSVSSFVLSQEAPETLTVNQTHSLTSPDGETYYYQVDATGYAKLKITLNSSDASMYVRQGALPNTSNITGYDCSAYATYPDGESCNVYLLPHSGSSTILYIGVTGSAPYVEPPPPPPIPCEDDPSQIECSDPCYYDPGFCVTPEAHYTLNIEAIGDATDNNQIQNITEPLSSGYGYGSSEILEDGDWRSYKVALNDQGIGSYSLSIHLENQPPYSDPGPGAEYYSSTDEVVLYAKSGSMPTESDYDCRSTLVGSQNCSIDLQQSSLEVFVLVRYKDDPNNNNYNYSSYQGQYRFTLSSSYNNLSLTPVYPQLNCGADYSSAYNQYGGFFNQHIAPNSSAFAALKNDGTIKAWGYAPNGHIDAPTDAGYKQVASNSNAFAALKNDGSITTWGSSSSGGSGAPIDSGYVRIFSTSTAFAALKADGSISVWGSDGYGAPTDNGYVNIYSNEAAFAALKADGSITVWGHSIFGGSGEPTDNSYVSITPAPLSFSALKSDGSVVTWGYEPDPDNFGPPTDGGYVSIFANRLAFAALKLDGSIAAWNDHLYSNSSAPTDNGYVSISGTWTAFAALKTDGSITAWGDSAEGGSGAPSDNGYVKIFSNKQAFAALKSDGSITAWGSSSHGGSGAPTDNGYVKIFSSERGFAALKSDGSISSWGGSSGGAPTDSGYINVASNREAFTALKSDGSIIAWGDDFYGGSNAPTEKGFVSINGSRPGLLTDCSGALTNNNFWEFDRSINAGEYVVFTVVANGDANGPLTYAIDNLPAWASFDSTTGTLSGTPGSSDVDTSTTIIVSVSDGTHTASLSPITLSIVVSDYDDDGVTDAEDAFRYDSGETLDTDGDGIGNNADTDDDNDGMPDVWEMQYALDPLDPSDANQDLDNDGQTNLQEYQNGTNPNQASTTGVGIVPIILEMLIE